MMPTSRFFFCGKSNMNKTEQCAEVGCRALSECRPWVRPAVQSFEYNRAELLIRSLSYVPKQLESLSEVLGKFW